MLQRHAGKHGYVLDIFYSNIEGEAINHIYRAVLRAETKRPKRLRRFKDAVAETKSS